MVNPGCLGTGSGHVTNSPGASNLILTCSVLPPSLVVDGVPSSIIPWKSTRGNLPLTSRLPAVGFPPPINPPAYPPSILALVSCPPPPSIPPAFLPFRHQSFPLPAIKLKNRYKCRHHVAILAPPGLAPSILPRRVPSRGKSPCQHPPLPGYPPGGLGLSDFACKPVFSLRTLVFVPEI